MVLRGKLTSRQDLFDLIKLISTTSMSVKVSFKSEFGNVSMSFNGGNLIRLKSGLDDTRLLICNFSNGKVETENFFKTAFTSLVYRFSDVEFQSSEELENPMFEVANLEHLMLDAFRELDETGEPNFSFRTPILEDIGSLSRNEAVVLGYISSGYSPPQAVFSMGDFKGFYLAYRNLVERGVIR